MKLSELINRGHDTALKWSECDEALVAVNETFGEPYESARKALHNDLLVATSREVPLDTFKGENNPLRFEDLKCLWFLNQAVPRRQETRKRTQESKGSNKS